MKKDVVLSGILGAVIGGVIVWILFMNNSIGVLQMTGIRGGNSRMMTDTDTMDAHFIEQMIPHHEDAITMANLALVKASHPEVKTLAENIISSQSKEIDQMKRWYKEWFGRGLPRGAEIMQHHGMGSTSGMHMGMMGDETDVTRLENATDFDREFVQEMIPHHQMAVMMASMLKNGTQKPEMKQLADDIITAQTNEIEQMREWLNDWENKK